MTNAAIAYSEEAYRTSGPRLMGAMSASEGFLRAYGAYSGAQEIIGYAATEPQFNTFIERLRAAGQLHPCRWVSPLEVEKLRAGGMLYVPDPVITDHAWQRRRAGDAAFSIMGVTHTTCSDSFMDLVGSWSVAPVQAWDAVVCTSQSVHRTLTEVLARYESYLRERLGATRFTRPQLPVIPLGVDVERSPAPEQAASFRRIQRAALGIGSEETAFLFLGRLSFHAKAHPLPMYLALEQAARRTKKKLHLILAGWFANEALERVFLEGAARHCPSVSIRLVDGRKPQVREQIWYAADIFTSLSDNIQETFGLTPIEAMAAGLPVVISDWNGYRDTVQHGVQGFLVPTTMPQPGCGEEMAIRFAAKADTYDRYIAHQSQCTAVDVAACTEYYVQLIEQPELRRRFGDAGQTRARQTFSWRRIIAEYQQLWQELAAQRAQARHAAAGSWHPLRQDPLALFAGYATQALSADCRLRAMDQNLPHRAAQLYKDPLANYAGKPFVLLDAAAVEQLAAALASSPATVAELQAAFPVASQRAVVRTLGWMLKCGLIAIHP